MLFALSSGCVFSAMVARKVGYTIAVPQPNNDDSKIKCSMLCAHTKPINATACNSIPLYSIFFLQNLSAIAPVTN